MWGALGTQPGKWLAGRADSVNSCCAALPDPSLRVAGVEVLLCQLLEVCMLGHRGQGRQEKPEQELLSLRNGSCELMCLHLGFHMVSVSLSFCLYLSVPLEGDSGSPLWLTTQSVTLCAASPAGSPPSQHPAQALCPWPPRPYRLCLSRRPLLSSFLFTHLRAHLQSHYSLSLQPLHPPTPMPLPSLPHPSVFPEALLFVLSHLSPPALGLLPSWPHPPGLSPLGLSSLSHPSSSSPAGDPTSSVPFHYLVFFRLSPLTSGFSSTPLVSDLWVGGRVRTPGSQPLSPEQPLSWDRGW